LSLSKIIDNTFSNIQQELFIMRLKT